MYDNMKNPKVSVIIPVYNTEMYLKECLDSIIRQSYENLEIIIVNDGSSDNSPIICNEYAKNDTRIILVNKLNGGASDARNCGLSVSSGEYILFVDSDDYWSDNSAVENLIDIVYKYQKVDVVLFRRNVFYHLNNKIVSFSQFDIDQINGKNKTDVLSYLMKSSYYSVSACEKLIRREVLIENKILFEKGRTAEDIDWCFNLMLCVNHIYAINHIFYQNRIRSGSVTSNGGLKNTMDLLYMIKKWSVLLYEIDIDKNQQALFLGYCSYLYAILMGHLYNYDRSIRKKLLKDMLPLKYLIEYDINNKTHQVLKIYKLCGFKMTCRILHFYLFLRNKGYRF